MKKPRNEKIDPTMLDAYYMRAMHKLLSELQSAYQATHGATGMTQKDIAERLGMGEAYVSHCLRGHKNMTLRTMSKLARAMDYRIEVGVASVNAPHLSNLPVQGSWQKLNDGVASGGEMRPPIEHPSPVLA